MRIRTLLLAVAALSVGAAGLSTSAMAQDRGGYGGQYQSQYRSGEGYGGSYERGGGYRGREGYGGWAYGGGYGYAPAAYAYGEGYAPIWPGYGPHTFSWRYHHDYRVYGYRSY
jgi:hypothetical protein